MSNLIATYTHTIVPEASTRSHFRVTAAANHKVWVKVTVFYTRASSNAAVAVDLRNGSTSGTLGSAITWVKRNPDDAETVQTVGQAVTGTPSAGDSVSKAGLLDNGAIAFEPIRLNGGETLDVWLTAGDTSGTGFIRIDIDE